MADIMCPGPVSEGNCIREAVCIHTKKIFDSCRDKDCVEDLRVYLTQDSQANLERATSVKARSAELLYTYLDVESVAFNEGFYTIDLTFYYRILVDAVVGAGRPSTIYGLAVFSKRVMLYGSGGSSKVFSSCANLNGPDTQLLSQVCKPQAVVETVEPILLSARFVEPNCCCRCEPDIGEVPACIGCCFDDTLITGGDGRRLYVTLGQFSIIRLERDTQLLIPVYDYCVPTKDCSASGTGGTQDEDPCTLFGRMQFPVSEFFPAGSAGNVCACGCQTGGQGMGQAMGSTSPNPGCSCQNGGQVGGSQNPGCGCQNGGGQNNGCGGQTGGSQNNHCGCQNNCCK